MCFKGEGSDGTVIPFINIYAQIGQEEKAIKHLRILVEELSQNMDFYFSLSDENLQKGWNTELRYDEMAMNEIRTLVQNFTDQAAKQEILEKLNKYNVTNLRN